MLCATMWLRCAQLQLWAKVLAFAHLALADPQPVPAVPAPVAPVPVAPSASVLVGPAPAPAAPPSVPQHWPLSVLPPESQTQSAPARIKKKSG